MQESRRRSRLEFCMLSLSLAAAASACACSPHAKGPESARHAGPDDAEAAHAVPKDDASRKAPAPPEAESEPELPKGTLVLHVGDSFAAALGVPLAKRLRAAGLRSVLEYKTASYIPTWAYGKELGRYVARWDPDLVLITLGANEFDIPAPDQRAPAIQRLVEKLGGRPCVWVLPPRWKQDTGLLDVIRDHAAPCRTLESDTLVQDLPRARDGVHPSKQGREIWADAVFEWLIHARDPNSDEPWALR